MNKFDFHEYACILKLIIYRKYWIEIFYWSPFRRRWINYAQGVIEYATDDYGTLVQVTL